MKKRTNLKSVAYYKAEMVANRRKRGAYRAPIIRWLQVDILHVVHVQHIDKCQPHHVELNRNVGHRQTNMSYGVMVGHLNDAMMYVRRYSQFGKTLLYHRRRMHGIFGFGLGLDVMCMVVVDNLAEYRSLHLCHLDLVEDYLNNKLQFKLFNF